MLPHLCTLVLTCALFPFVSAYPQEDRIESLPDYGPPKTLHFSGYLDGTDGCDTTTNGPFCKIHYWLATAEGYYENKPTVLWLNGGPGSSSLLGFVQENGPLLINATGGLMDNPYAWTKLVNLLVIESPVGVGYSFCANQLLGQVCKNTDKFTASTARAAIVSFFDKFPTLLQNDFHITGESYAGVYIPTLAHELVTNAPHIPLKGLAVGDPCTDNTAQADSMDALWYGHKYGLVDDAVFDVLWNKCETRFPSFLLRNRVLLTDKGKLHAEEEFLRSLSYKHDSDECQLALRKFLMSSSGALSQGWRDLYIDDYSLFAPVTNTEDEDMAAYLTRADVRKALHVSDTPVKDWPYPEAGFDYTKEYDACNYEVESGALSMIDFYRKLAPKLKTIIVYNGDTDPCVTYEGTRTAIARVGFPEIDGGGYRPWFYNHSATPIEVLAEKAPLFGPGLLVQDMGPQFGGEVVNYENNLSFVTFHGSGHMVPQFRPQAALHMLEKLISYAPLSPLLPTNETLVSLSEDEFEAAMNDWTERARASPFV